MGCQGSATSKENALIFLFVAFYVLIGMTETVQINSFSSIHGIVKV